MKIYLSFCRVTFYPLTHPSTSSSSTVRRRHLTRTTCIVILSSSLLNLLRGRPFHFRRTTICTCGVRSVSFVKGNCLLPLLPTAVESSQLWLFSGGSGSERGKSQMDTKCCVPSGWSDKNKAGDKSAAQHSSAFRANPQRAAHKLNIVFLLCVSLAPLRPSASPACAAVSGLIPQQICHDAVPFFLLLIPIKFHEQL